MASEEVEYRCVVRGLALAIDDTALETVFSQYDAVDSEIIYNRETGKSKGYGFVTFKDEESMKDAIEGLNGQELDGHTITVKEAQPRHGGYKPNGGGGGNGGGYYKLAGFGIM